MQSSLVIEGKTSSLNPLHEGWSKDWVFAENGEFLEPDGSAGVWKFLVLKTIARMLVCKWEN